MSKLLKIIICLCLLLMCSGCNINEKHNNSSTTKMEESSITSENTEDISSIENTLKNAYDKQENLNFLVENGFIVFEDQSFSTEFENFGEVRFVSGGIEGDNPFELRLYLTDNNGKIIYSIPDFCGNKWSMLTELSAVAFKDVNKDGLKDIIIIAYYMTGVGENGAEEFPVAGIYFQREMEFIDISEIDDQINAGGKNENIEVVIKFTKSIDFSKLSPSKTSSKQIDTSIGAAKNLETATIKQPELTITPTSTPTVTPTNYPDC